MTNYKEILRLQSLGINNTRIAEACGCARSTVISTLQHANAKDAAVIAPTFAAAGPRSQLTV